MKGMLRAFLATSLLLSLSARADSSHLECTADGGTKIAFTAKESGRFLVAQDQRFSLTQANLGETLPPGSPNYYFALSPNGKTADMRTLVRTQFFQSGGRPSLSVDILVDNRPFPKLACPVSDYHLPVVPHTGSPARFAEPLIYWGGRIDREGKLKALSLLALEASLLQFYHWPASSERGQTDAFLKLAGPTLLKTPPAAFETIRRRLTKKEKDFVDILLADVRYRYHPESKRYADWVVEGLDKKDAEQVRGGFAAFFHSPAFKAPDMRTFFKGEVEKRLPSMTPYDLTAMAQNYSPDQEAFVLKIWGEARKADYAAIKTAFPHLLAMEDNLSPRQTDFSPFVLAFSKLVQADALANPIVRAHLKTHMLPAVDKLPGKEKQSLLTALGDGGNAALNSLRK